MKNAVVPFAENTKSYIDAGRFDIDFCWQLLITFDDGYFPKIQKNKRKKLYKKSKAGFAKVMVADENKKQAQKFVDSNIDKDATLHTDRGSGLIYLENIEIEHKAVSGDKELLDSWLPWVHKFISNAKIWVLGTHHGVDSKYLGSYLSEYTFRFNRRHDPDSMFYRALGACVKATPKTSQTLFG